MTSFYWIIDILGGIVILGALWAVFVALPMNTRRAELQCYVAMARAVEAREPHLVGQAEQTARFAVLMSILSMRVPPTRILRIETSALLHTMGKVGVSYALLNSPQSLRSSADRYAVREYVRIGAAMLEAVPSLKACVPAVLYHKEYLDGSGYPFGRFGDAIPFDARVLCVASEFVALTSPRIYRAGLAMQPGQAIEYLLEHSGSRYDKTCVALLIRSHQTMQFLSRFKRKATPTQNAGVDALPEMAQRAA